MTTVHPFLMILPQTNRRDPSRWFVLTSSLWPFPRRPGYRISHSFEVNGPYCRCLTWEVFLTQLPFCSLAPTQNQLCPFFDSSSNPRNVKTVEAFTSTAPSLERTPVLTPFRPWNNLMKRSLGEMGAVAKLGCQLDTPEKKESRLRKHLLKTGG